MFEVDRAEPLCGSDWVRGNVIEIDARDFGVRVALWVGTFFHFRWSREIASPERALLVFEAGPDTATVRLTTHSDGGWAVESEGGFRVAHPRHVGDMSQLIDRARRPIFEIAYSGLVVVRTQPDLGHPSRLLVGPIDSDLIEDALDRGGAEVVQQWWGWPKK